jgi:hypothetical protein
MVIDTFARHAGRLHQKLHPGGMNTVLIDKLFSGCENFLACVGYVFVHGLMVERSFYSGQAITYTLFAARRKRLIKGF